ncbi:flavin-containing monooxygenase [Pseudonocardia alni]|uniref:flavin-containing monooxygenase n=1 Tax=Pseudonocardia alni TaxID=33907 RepID=UPI00340EDE4B
MTTPDHPAPRYCVIGAGAAGLATVRALRDAGVEFDCFERSEHVGGHWNTDYEALHLISARDVSAFRGHPMPGDYPYYPSRLQVVDYLNDFADAYDLRRHIMFGVEVVRAEPVDPDGRTGWTVTLGDGTERHYAGVVVANGHLWDPRTPEVAGEFTGTVLHSSDYHDVGDVTGDRVLVVGTGNSGCDIAVDVAQDRRHAYVVMRSGQLFQPKSFFGRPRANLPIAKLPPLLAELATVALTRIVNGGAAEYGMPAPRSWRLKDSPPIVNTQLLHWIQHGRIEIVPTIERFDDDKVVLTDGRVLAVDTVIWCTGFHVSLPFLDESLVPRRDGIPLRHAATVLPPTVEGLFYIGLCAPRGGQFPFYDVQAELLVDMIALRERGDVALSREFAAREEPEWRLDVMPHLWFAQVERTRKHLAALAAALPTRAGSPAGTTPSSKVNGS